MTDVSFPMRPMPTLGSIAYSGEEAAETETMLPARGGGMSCSSC